MKFRSIFTAAIATVLAVTTISAANATVTFDPATGAGFVGKGDVQLAFGWSNQQLQDRAVDVTFQYNEESRYEATCEVWVTRPDGRSSTVTEQKFLTNTKTSNVVASVASDARKRSQVTGFNLSGMAVINNVQPIPLQDGACTAFGTDGKYTSVSLVGLDQKLSSLYNGQAVMIWPSQF